MSFLEPYIPHFFALGFGVIGVYAFKKYMEYKLRLFNVKQKKIEKTVQEDMILRNLGNTIGESLMMMQQAQETQLAQIDKGQDDETILILRRQLAFTQKLRGIFANPVVSFLDGLLFPMVRPQIPSLLPKLMKRLSEWV